MKVNKEGAFNSFSNDKKGENIIILELLQEITAADFENNAISKKMSSLIFENL